MSDKANQSNAKQTRSNACSADGFCLRSVELAGCLACDHLSLPFRGDVNAPARSVEHSADAFTSIDALSAWLKAQGDVSSSSELLRLRAAVAVLANYANPKKEDLCPLFATWDCQQKEQQTYRPLAMFIAELLQAVLVEGTRLRARGLAPQLGVSANSVTGEGTDAAQPASINAARSRVVRPIACASGERSSDAFTLCETGEETSVAQSGSKTKQRRGSAMLTVVDRQQVCAASGSTSESSRPIASNASVAQRVSFTNRQRATDGFVSAAQASSAAASSSIAASSVPTSATEALQRRQPADPINFHRCTDRVAEGAKGRIELIRAHTVACSSCRARAEAQTEAG